MGANQSEDNRPRQPPTVSATDVERILVAQRQKYEQKLQEELAKQRIQQIKEQEAKERQAKEQQAKQQVEQSSNFSCAGPSNANGGAQQPAAAAPPLYPNLNPTPMNVPMNQTYRLNYPVHVNQPHPLNQSNPFNQPNTVFQPYPLHQGHALNQPQPWNPPQQLNPPHPRNQSRYNNSYQNRATSTPPPHDFVFVNGPGQRSRPNPSAPVEPSVPTAPSPTPAVAPFRRPRNRSTNRSCPVDDEGGIYDCPTCKQRYGLKIFQCISGHSACNDCKIRGRACGICKQSLTEIRNFEVESHIAQTPAPCPYENEGCNVKVKQIKMEEHLTDCPYSDQQCPLFAIFGTCSWKGKLSEMSTHFDEMHSPSRGIDVNKEIHLKNIQDSSQQVHLVVIGVYNFLCHLKVSESDGKVFMAVQLLGTKMSAKRWSYEIHIYNKSQSRRKYTYTDTCISKNQKIEDVFNAGSCAVLPIFYAQSFFDKDGMAFKFFIKQNLNNNEENVNRNDNGKKYYNQRGGGRGRGRDRNYYKNYYNNDN